ncbi:hypothetical protein BC826DRAFT_1042562 [Russula brevipes]|nr:hypothetical protein BC826DRAFT_1042562 [Russula brevipes]
MKEVRFSCSGKGALLYLPFPARRFDTIALGDFSMWIHKNIDRLFVFANSMGFAVQQMEIVFVTGYHITRSWISAAFPNSLGPATVSFAAETAENDSVYLSQGRFMDGVCLALGPSGQVSP